MGIRLTDCAQNYLAEVSLSGKARSLDTARRALDRIVLILGKVPLADLQPAHVRRLKEHLRADGLKPVTINHYLKYLAAALRQARTEGLVEDFPRIQLMKAPLPEPHALSAEEVGRLLQMTGHEPMHTMLLLLVSTGMRISELIYLNWSDWRDGVLTITAKPDEDWSPKSHQERSIDLREAPEVVKAMELHREREKLTLGRTPRPDDPIFPNHKTRTRKRRFVQVKLSKHLSAAFCFDGINGTAHTLRRSHATIAKAAGADLDTIRRTLGHSTLAVTERYFAPDPQAQKRSIAGIAAALEAAQK